MEKIWKIKESGNLVDDSETSKYHRVILELLAKRGISDPAEVERFFNSSYERDILDPFLFSGMEKAVARITEAKKKKEKIAVFGDYDADGVTATIILVETLEQLGFEKVIYYIPDRQLEGYGLNIEAIEYLQKEKVKLIVTVDCGITNLEEVAKAQALGMDIIITDHHHVPEKIPEALAVINPHQKNSGYPFPDLAGVGVALKLAEALYQKINPEKKEQLKWALDLAAIGTIADCVPLQGENRVLAKYGLLVLSKTRRLGLQELFKVGSIQIDADNVPNARKIAFQVAPRVNAAGRMDHANMAYELIRETDRVKARDLALEVESKNQQRQKVTAEIAKQVRLLAGSSFKDKKFIFAENEHWPVGILGLVAGKIAEEFGKPTAILQKQAKEIVGSFRSIPTVDIMEMLEKCQELLIRFGGHSQAAGVRLLSENAKKFYEQMEKNINAELAGRELIPEIEVDLEIKPEDINWDLAMELKKLEPFGQGNEEPLFLMRRMAVMETKVVGNGNKHLKVQLRAENGGPKIFEAIGFRMGERKIPQNGEIIDLVFSLAEDEWNGNKKLQLTLVDFKKSI
ncbi:MAG: single-stranded-DNA-specific exonuclease RecJ [Candidatus Moranbacteria bacterium]|nr:single-stranded-DNA-specific exonuclease RecJ [Candidatus Moranbacteria bacterium]